MSIALSPRRIVLGDVDLVLDGIELRTVCVGGVEVLRRLHVAVRDADWATLDGDVATRDVDVDGDRLWASFEVVHQAGGVHLGWRGELEVTADGSVRYMMDAIAKSDFDYARIGLVALHPPSLAGRPWRSTGAGPARRGRLPQLVGPQWIHDERVWPLIGPYTGLRLDHGDGVSTVFAFDGDQFEMEDQRNWTDASFKTYSTPLALGWPHPAVAGQRLSQTVRMRVTGRPRTLVAELSTPAVEVGQPTGYDMPAIGLGMPDDAVLDQTTMKLLAHLRLDHLRVHLDANADTVVNLANADRTAARLGCELEVVIDVQDPSELADASSWLTPAAPVARVMVFDPQGQGSGTELVDACRPHLAHLGDVSVGSGTDGQLADLNRTRPSTVGLDVLAFSVTPQFHAVDNTSVMENTDAQADAVRTAAAFGGGVPVAVGPITLRPRTSPWASPDELPMSVDRRQALPFAAAWTVASLAALLEGGAEAVTWFELAGWRGIAQGGADPPNDAFPAVAGDVFPVHAVFASLADRTGPVLQVSVSPAHVSQVAAVAFEVIGGRRRVLVANRTSMPLQVSVGMDGKPTIIELDAYGVATSTGNPLPATGPARGDSNHSTLVFLTGGSNRSRKLYEV